MKLNAFKIEDWLNIHEQDVRYHLSESCAPSLTLQEFLTLVDEPVESLLALPLSYSDITGSYRLRTAIASLYPGITADQVAVCQGCSNANTDVLLEFTNPGMKLIVPTPTYDHFTSFAESIGVEVLPFPFNDQEPFPMVSFLKKLEQVDACAIVNPNNPTGYKFSDSDIQQIQETCDQHQVLLFVDEAYRWMSLKPPTSFANGTSQSVITTGGLAKAFALPGLRVGWIIGSKEQIEKINSRRNYSIIALSPLQDLLASLAIEHKDLLLERTQTNIRINRQFLTEWLNENSSWSISSSESSLCLLHSSFDSAAFSEALYQSKRILLAPGECFGLTNCYRLSFSIQPEVFQAGLQEVAQFAKHWQAQ